MTDRCNRTVLPTRAISQPTKKREKTVLKSLHFVSIPRRCLSEGIRYEAGLGQEVTFLPWLSDRRTTRPAGKHRDLVMQGVYSMDSADQGQEPSPIFPSCVHRGTRTNTTDAKERSGCMCDPGIDIFIPSMVGNIQPRDIVQQHRCFALPC